MVACSSGVADSGGDGILDCGVGQVGLPAGITASGVAEAEVAKVALKGWALNGATVKEFPAEGTWSAVLAGEDIAIAVAEQQSDGSWVVSDVAVCGAP
jgi:hypothetical protein